MQTFFLPMEKPPPEFQNAEECKEKSINKLVNYENGKAHEKNIVEKGDYIVVNSSLYQQAVK